MLTEERNRVQHKLEENIKALAETTREDADIRLMALKLKDVYRKDFRHSYCKFFPLVLEIQENPKYNLDFLSENLDSLKKYMEDDFVAGKKEFEDIYDNVEKLCDHLILEIGRCLYYSKNEQRIEDVTIQTKELNDEIVRAAEELDHASRQASSIQTELIAVLSIFAAIVVTFSGGFTFLGSVMTSINDANYYEVVVLMAIVCGMAMFNTIFLMMYLVAKITERNIYARCKRNDCSECGANECRGLKKIQKRLPYVYYFNILCILGMILDVAVWYCDIKGFI